MSEARSPSLPWISCDEKPSDSVGTRKQAIPRWRFSGSVWAKISATSATLPSEIHIFWPVIRQPPSIFSARVRIDEGSEPASGSVSPKQPNASPEHSRGSHCFFCSSVPQRSIEPQTSEVWTETTVRAEESPRPISSTISP